MIAVSLDITGVAEVQAALSSLPNAVTTRLRGCMTGAGLGKGGHSNHCECGRNCEWPNP